MTRQNTMGFVTVEPNEYVIHTRLGKTVNEGLGQTFFSFPYIDSYIKFPVSPRKVNFYADNITKEKQGVGIQGFLIWSIDDGSKAYKKIASEISDNKDKCQKENLSDQLNDISVSITRHAISNMDLNEVLMNRDALVERLNNQLNEIITDWGIKIEAIEIKEVRVLSDVLFESMQAPYRNEQFKIAEHSRLENQKLIKNTETEAEAAVRIRKAEQELIAKSIELDNLNKQKDLEHNSQILAQERNLKERIKQIESQNEKEKIEKELHKQQVLLDEELSGTIEKAKRSVLAEQNLTIKQEISNKAEEDLLQKQAEIDLKASELEFSTKENDAYLEYLKAKMSIQNSIGKEALMQVLFEEMGNSMKNMNFDRINWYSMGDKHPMSALPASIIEIVTLLQGSGILNQVNSPTES